VSFGKITQAYSTIGKIDVDAIRTLLNMSMRIVKPAINKRLAKGIPVPKSFNETLVINDASFVAHKDYVSITFAPEFL